MTCLSDIHMRFDMSKIFKILYTSCVMCSSDIHVRYLREWFSGWRDFWNMGGWKLCDIMMHCFWRLCDIIMYHIWKILDCLGAGFISGVGKKKVICGDAGSDYTWCVKRGGWYFVWCRRVCALLPFSVWKKKNDFMVMCSISFSNFEYSPKAFPVGATSIYLLEV